MKKLLIMIGIIPVLAMFGGVGILAYRISETWNAATTQALVTGLTVICGGGVLVLCILIAFIVGVPLAIRAYGEGGLSRRQWGSAGRSGLSDVEIRSPHGELRRPPPMVEGQWRPLVHPSPPWGVPGGVQNQLLPPSQDDRFGIEG